jgi:hypothetical protein
VASTKGIEGIRKLNKDNRSGWHVFVNDVRIEYVEKPFRAIVQENTGTLTYVGGNTLHFED